MACAKGLTIKMWNGHSLWTKAWKYDDKKHENWEIIFHLDSPLIKKEEYRTTAKKTESLGTRVYYKRLKS